MERIFRVILTLLMISALAACAGSTGGGSGDDDDEGVNGVYTGEGDFVVELEVLNTTNNDPPATATCEGSIEVTVDLDATPQIEGAGDCLMPANAASYTVNADFVDDESFEGEIVITFNGAEHVLPLEGSVDGNEITATFVGQTFATAILTIDWNGEFSASKDDAGDEEEPATGGAVNGEYEGNGDFEVRLTVSDTQLPTAPSVADCVGSIELIVDDEGNPDVAGEGDCSMPNNFISFTLEGDLVDGGEWEGEIVLRLNNRDHVLDVQGEVDGDEIVGEFTGQTNATARLVIDWEGEFSAERADD